MQAALDRAMSPAWRKRMPSLTIAALATIVLAIAVASRLMVHEGAPMAMLVQSADLLMQDRDNGSIVVTAAPCGRVVDIVAPGSNGFLRVLLAGLVHERARERVATPGFHITRWSDGRLTIDDVATGRLIELEAFGPANAEAFGRLLDLAVQVGCPSG